MMPLGPTIGIEVWWYGGGILSVSLIMFLLVGGYFFWLSRHFITKEFAVMTNPFQQGRDEEGLDIAVMVSLKVDKIKPMVEDIFMSVPNANVIKYTSGVQLLHARPKIEDFLTIEQARFDLRKEEIKRTLATNRRKNLSEEPR